MFCIRCGKSYTKDELDSDNICFDCANYDPHTADMTDVIKKFIEDTMNNLADAKNTTSDQIKNDYVAEHVRKNPEKYAKEIYQQNQKPIKKREPESN